MSFYFSAAAAYCIFLISKMFKDEECPNTDIASWTIILLASLLWVIVIPISLLELRNKAKTKADNIITAQEIEGESQDSNTPITDY